MRALGVLIFLAVLAFVGNYAAGTMHIGAPNFYPNYAAHCPKGTVFRSWWVKSSDPKAFGYYRGWQELGGCGASVHLSVG